MMQENKQNSIQKNDVNGIKSNRRMSGAKIIKTRDIALIGVMVATIEVVKQALAFIPNVEMVTLLIVLYALVFGRRIYYAIPAFVLIEGCLYGFGIWWIMYLYIWPLLAFLTRVFKKQESPWFWAVFTGSFGLMFGALCSIPYFFIDGWHGALTWWVAGIPYDILHGISNAVLCLVLFRPLYRVLKKLEM